MRARMISGLLAIVMLFSFLPGMAVKASADSVMTTSESAVNLIKEYEGFSATAYWDNTQWSIGYGTKSTQGATITMEEAHTAMMAELQEVEKALNEFTAKYGLYLSQNQFDALASLSYNCGTKWMTTSGRLRQAVTDGKTGNDFLFAISLWANISSVPNAGLLKRRMSEANLYLSATYDKAMPSNYTYVIFNPNGGTPGHSGEDKMQGYCTDTAVNIMVEDPTRTGYTFRGWYTAASGGEKVESLTASIGGKTLYAQWTAPDGTVATEEVIATGTVKCETSVNIRSGAGTNYTSVGSAYNGDKVNIYEKKTVGTQVWGRIDGGWICLDYVTLDSSPSNGSGSGLWGDGTSSGESTTQTGKSGIVTGNGVNVRQAAGINSTRVGSLNKGAKVTVYEQTTVGSTPWGRIGTNQWICMNYVKLDSDSNTSGSGTSSTGNTGKVSSTTNLNVRSGAGTNYSRVGSLTPGTAVTILERKTVGGVEWGRIGTNRWICLTYVTMDGSSNNNNSNGNSGLWGDSDSGNNSTTTTGKTGTVTGNGVNVRKAAGVNNARVTYLNKGAKVTVYEQTTVGGVSWGRIGTDQWICMTYVKLDGESDSSGSSGSGGTTAGNQTGTVTTGLNVRSGAGTNYAKVGSLSSGDKVTIYETKTIGTAKWGRIGTNRWISLAYVKLDGTDSSGSTGTTAEPGKGTVTTTLNVRSGAGTGYTKVGTLAAGTAVTITETKNVSGVSWGKIGTDRWICMTYVKMDSASGSSSNTGSTGGNLWA